MHRVQVLAGRFETTSTGSTNGTSCSIISLQHTMSEGWDDDEDLGLDQIDSMEEEKNAGGKDVEDLLNEGGWADDDDDDDDLNINLDEQRQRNHNENTENAFAIADKHEHQPSNHNSAGGWEEDDELFGDDEEDQDDIEQSTGTSSHVFNATPHFPNRLQELQEYVESLNRILTSINAVLEYEYNTPEKAHELLHYYSARPGLAAYTRTKELPRMNYQVVLPNGRVETSKEQIAQHHLPDTSLMARCANQSLLADLIHVLTGPDLVVRPQFLAICVAMKLFLFHFLTALRLFVVAPVAVPQLTCSVCKDGS